MTAEDSMTVEGFMTTTNFVDMSSNSPQTDYLTTGSNSQIDLIVTGLHNNSRYT